MTESGNSRGSQVASSCEELNLAEDQQQISISLVRRSGDWSALEPVDEMVRACACATSQILNLPLGTGEIALALSDDAELRALNKAFRGQDKATNVLSFPVPSPAGEQLSDIEPFLGDVALAIETLRTEALELGIPLEHHFQHLVVHGLLHVLGYDHETAPDADTMEGLEVLILEGLRIPNPYQDIPERPEEGADHGGSIAHQASR